MNSLISVIVPCYNQAQYLDECLQSVLDQTYQNWECIIVNDGSPDHTEEVAKKWLEKDNRFRYIYKENGGLSSARNAGIREAKGEYLFFLDSDDSLNGNLVFKSLISNLTENIDFICADLQEVHKESIIKENYFSVFYNKKTILSGKKILQDLLQGKFPIIACNKIIKKNTILENNIYFKEGILHEDELFTLYLCLHSNNVIVLKEITYNYNKTNITSITGKAQSSIKSINDRVIIVKEYLDVMMKEDTYFKALFISKIFRLTDSILLNSVVFKNYLLWNKYFDILEKIFYANGLNKYFKRHYGNKIIKYFTLRLMWLK